MKNFLFTGCMLCCTVWLYATSANGTWNGNYYTVEDFEGTAPTLTSSKAANLSVSVVSNPTNSSEKAAYYNANDYGGDIYMSISITLPTGTTLNDYDSILFDWRSTSNTNKMAFILFDGTKKCEESNGYNDSNGTWKTKRYKISTLSITTENTFTFSIGSEQGTQAYHFDNIRLYGTPPATNTYTVTFDAGSGSCDTTSLTESAENGGVPLPATATVSCNWALYGWATAACSETTTAPTVSTAGNTYYPTENGTLYAVYTKNSTYNSNPTCNVYTVTFHAGSGSCTTVSATQADEGSAVSLPTTATPNNLCATEGWTFYGWATSVCAETTTTPTTVTSYTPVANATLYAIYSNSGTYNTNPIYCNSLNGTLTTSNWLILEDYECDTLGSVLTMYNSSVSAATVAADPNNTEEHSAHVTSSNYGDCLVKLDVTLPTGKTLSDYDSISFNIYALSGYDNTYKPVNIKIGSTTVHSQDNGIASVSSSTLYICQYAFAGFNQSGAATAVANAGNSFTMYLGATNGNTLNYYLDNIRLHLTGGYTVIFHAGSGSCATASLTETAKNAGVTLPSATANSKCTGWIFQGWSTTNISETSSEPTILNSNSTYHPTGNSTLYAVYKNDTLYATAPVIGQNGSIANGYLMINDFENDAVETTYKMLHWYNNWPSEYKSEITVSPTDATNQVALVWFKNYDNHIILNVTLPTGKTLKDYEALSYDYYTDSTLNFQMRTYINQYKLHGETDYINPNTAFANSDTLTSALPKGEWNNYEIYFDDFNGTDANAQNRIDAAGNSFTLEFGPSDTIGAIYIDNVRLRERWTELTFDNPSGESKWSNPTDWSPYRNLLPNSKYHVRILDSCQLNVTTATVRNITLADTAKLIIPPLHRLTGDTVKNASTARLLIQADATGSGAFIFKGTPPQATVQFYSIASKVGSTWQWQYIGLPVDTFPADQMHGGYMYQYSENHAPDGWVAISNSNTLSAFTGYCITQKSAHRYTLWGSLNNANRNITLSYGNATSYPGFNLAGNSYSAPIDISKMTADDFTNAYATIYIYNTGSYADWQTQKDSYDATGTGQTLGQYITLPIATVSALGTNALKIIPSGQGFFVEAKSGGGNLALNYDRIVRGNTATNRPMRARTAENTDLLRIKISGKRYADEVHLLSYPTCSHDYENGYDGFKQFGMEAAPQIYAVEEAGLMAVDAVDNFEGQLIGIQAGEDSEYLLTFECSDHENQWYIHDLQTLQTTAVSGENSYLFSVQDKNRTTRFLIDRQPSNNTPTAVSSLPLESSVSAIRIFDLTGRCIYTKNIEEEEECTPLPFDFLPQGMYLVQLIAEKHCKSLKIIR